MPRTRGIIIGLCLIVLGIWGAIIPFVGPYFHYAFINMQKWHFTWGRLWLDILPGAVTFLAGLILLGAGTRITARFAGWMAAIAGAWFVIGPQVSRFWSHGIIQAGHPLGGHTRQAFEQLGFFYALGAAIMLLAALAIGRAAAAAARDVVVAEGVGARFGRRRTATVGPRQPVTREPAVAPQQQPVQGQPPGGDVRR